MIGTIAKTELLDLARGQRSRALLVGVALLLLVSGWSAAGFARLAGSNPGPGPNGLPAVI